jgi:hypothetical protein
VTYPKNGRRLPRRTVKVMAAGVLAAAVAGAGIAAGLTYAAGGHDQAASGRSGGGSRPAAQPEPEGIRLVAFTGGDHGAAAAAGASAPACALSKLATDFWTTQPGLSGELLSGVTVTNTGPRCTLPTGLTSAAVISSSGGLVRQAGFAAPGSLRATSSGASLRPATAAAPLPEFSNLATTRRGQDLVASGLPGTVVSIRRLTLRTGGKAVLVIASAFSPNAVARNCLAAPAGGGLRLATAGSILHVRVPIMPAPAGGPENRTGSAFYACSTSAISPFLTWDQASSVVGGPAVVTGPSGPLPNVDNPIYKLAP